MALSPVTKAIKRRNIIAYDLEWWPGTLELRMVGVHDGASFRWYRTTLEFLLNELRPETDGAWYFAHAGGLADFQFLLQDLIDHGFEVKAAFSGSSAIIVSVDRGDHTWFLIDSYWLLRSPLKQIGDAVGIKKLRDYLCPGSTLVDGRCDGKGCAHPQPEEGDEPFCIFYAPMNELVTYNEQDCLILWTAISQLQDELNAMGSELCMTQASSAMRLYRRSYLDQTIRTMPMLNEISRQAYVGSRVEVYAPRCDFADYYDINSSFPYAMTFPAPGNFRGASTSIPDSSEMFMADVEIEVPETYLPPIPWRHPKEHRVYFPTGKWRSWLSGIDVHLLLSQGGKVHKTYRVLKFDEQSTLTRYAEDLYAKRLRSTTPFEKMLYKLLLNSLYGKFGESPIKVAAYIHPQNPNGMQMVSPGVFLSEEIMEIEHEHVPISMHITAFARRTLYRFNKLCLDLGGRLYYNDTDSAVTTIGPERLPPGIIGDKLGMMKHEYHVRNGVFVAPKIYMLDAEDMESVHKLKKGGLKEKDAKKYAGKDERLMKTLMERGVDEESARGLARKDVVRAKGFSRMTVSKFHDIVEGRELSVRRMSRVRELLRSGDFRPREGMYPKKLQIERDEDGEVHFKMRPKRCMLMKENNSRPWRIEELMGGKK